MQIQPYLFFSGRCDEAIAFYRKALGAEPGMLMRFKDNPDPSMHPDIDGEKVMHAQIRIGDATVLMSDGRREDQPGFESFGLSLTVADEAEAGRMFKALADGGTVRMPLGKTFFSAAFGMVADRFGVLWLVYVAK
jgi:PhnB protein